MFRNILLTLYFEFSGKKGSSAISPGLSCKNIKDSGDFNTSGKYWVKPSNSDRAFKVYCQMSAIRRKFSFSVKIKN